MNGTRPEPLVRIGDLLRIPEAHYLYGVGTLTLRATFVGEDLSRYPTLQWVRLRGIQIHHNGAEGDTREVTVRVAALRSPGVVTRAAKPPDTAGRQYDGVDARRIRASRTRI